MPAARHVLLATLWAPVEFLGISALTFFLSSSALYSSESRKLLQSSSRLLGTVALLLLSAPSALATMSVTVGSSNCKKNSLN